MKHRESCEDDAWEGFAQDGAIERVMAPLEEGNEDLALAAPQSYLRVWTITLEFRLE